MAITLVRPSQINGVPVGANLESLLKADNTEVTVTNTVTETTIWTFTIPGGDMGANDAIRLMLSMSWLQNTGVTQTWTYRVKLGGTTILTATPTLATAGATTGGGFLTAVIKNAGATNSQKGIMAVTGGAAVPVSGQPGAFGTSAIDMTINQALAVTVQFAAATATQTLVELFAELEFLKAT